MDQAAGSWPVKLFSMFIQLINPDIKQRLRSLVTACLVLPMILSPALAQDKKSSPAPVPLPPAYATLTTDTARMRFLVKVINDSLNEDQLTPVYDWSRKGLAIAESNTVDSLKGIFNFFIGKAYTYKLLRPDSAIVYYKKALPHLPNKMGGYYLFSMREIMERYSEMGNKDSSFVYLNSLTAVIDTLPETSARRVSLSQNIATVYQWFGMFKTAIRYYQTSVNGERKNGHLPGLGMALANLGELYSESQDDQKALLYSKEALNYLSDANMPYANTASNIAGYYCNLGQYDSALVYLDRSRRVAEKIGDEAQLATLRVVLGEIYLGQKKFELAGPFLENNLASLKKYGNPSDLIKTHLSLSSLDTSLHRYAAANDHLQSALKMARENKQQILVAVALQNLTFLHEKMKDYKKAFEFQQEYLNLKDSMTSENTKASLADFQVSYQTLQKEETIRLLQQDNAIKNLQLQNSRRSLIFYLLSFLMALIILAIIFYQRNLRNKIRAQKTKAELETKVLRLQMNPHFIFNSLNSIENFIMHNEKRLASDYLNKFARLIRMILDSSRTEVVPIAKDMEALQLYVDLEQLRFNHKFSYKAYVDPALLGGDYRAPSLLIQPYVENAIMHGLAHSDEEDLHLTVTATLVGDKIKYVVQDNGVGREKSKEYNTRNKPYHESVGLKITEDRIHIFNKGGDGAGAIKIIDLYNEEKTPGGTKVEIIINAV